MDNQDFNIPNNLNAQGQQAAEAIVALMTAELANPSGGGGKAFYTPEEWSDRGEDYGQGAVLIVVHDGGDQARYFNLDYEQYGAFDRMNTRLEQLGLYAEQCTCWYSAVYDAR
jgi:hypothetical protein